MGGHCAQAGLEHQVGQGGWEVGERGGGDRLFDCRGDVQAVLDANDVRLGEGNSLGGLLEFVGGHPALQNHCPVDDPDFDGWQAGLDHRPLDGGREVLLGRPLLGWGVGPQGDNSEEDDEDGHGDPGGATTQGVG